MNLQRKAPLLERARRGRQVAAGIDAEAIRRAEPARVSIRLGRTPRESPGPHLPPNPERGAAGLFETTRSIECPKQN